MAVLEERMVRFQALIDLMISPYFSKHPFFRFSIVLVLSISKTSEFCSPNRSERYMFTVCLYVIEKEILWDSNGFLHD